MSPEATTWVIVGALVFGAFGTITVMVIRDVRYPRGDFMPVRPEPAHHKAPEYPTVWLHAAPSVPPTIPQAHRDMQLHMLCYRDECGRKNAAYRALRAAGRIRA